MKKPIACVLPLLLAGCIATTTNMAYIDEHKTKEEILSLFKESTIVGFSFDPARRPAKEGIRYFIDPVERMTDQDHADWQQLIALIESETPLRFTKAKDAASANLFISLAPTFIDPNYPCYEERTYGTDPTVLEKVTLEIDRASTGLLQPCVLRSFMVSIGFNAGIRTDPAYALSSALSVLNKRTKLSQPTSTDLYLINLMLKSGLRHDMSSSGVDAAISRQYDLIQLSSAHRRPLEDIDADQRKTLLDALEPRPQPAHRIRHYPTSTLPTLSAPKQPPLTR